MKKENLFADINDHYTKERYQWMVDETEEAGENKNEYTKNNYARWY